MRNSRTLTNRHLLAPRDVDEQVARAWFLLAMLAAVAVVATSALLFVAMT
ncbi:hypothetical protein ACFWPA_13805 [Rhodococcus sp. NPDC058505]